LSIDASRAGCSSPATSQKRPHFRVAQKFPFAGLRHAKGWFVFFDFASDDCVGIPAA
jgi:hypothetical protein